MSSATSQLSGSARRRVLALAAAFWIGLGLQPCALAAASELECPHAPGTDAAAMPSGHHHPAADEAPDCDAMQPSCCEAGDSAVEGRFQPGKIKADGDVVLAPPPSGINVETRRATRPPGETWHFRVPDPGRPLHLLNCVFLD